MTEKIKPLKTYQVWRDSSKGTCEVFNPEFSNQFGVLDGYEKYVTIDAYNRKKALELLADYQMGWRRHKGWIHENKPGRVNANGALEKGWWKD